MTTFWIIVGLISLVLLLVTFFGERNAVWGGLTFGVLMGLIVALVYFYTGRGFEWLTIYKGAVIGVIVGFFAELLPTILKRH